MQTKMDEAALTAFLADAFPQVDGMFEVQAVTDDGIRIGLVPTDAHLRPGGTVSGPTMFSLVDVAMYLALLSRIGPQALAVTTNCSIDFMRKPPAGAPLVAEARLLKLGRALAVGDVMVVAEGQSGPVARANLTYSIPPAKKADGI